MKLLYLKVNAEKFFGKGTTRSVHFSLTDLSCVNETFLSTAATQNGLTADVDFSMESLCLRPLPGSTNL